MPGKFVFPGGAVDAGDADVPLASALQSICTERLRQEGNAAPSRFVAAAIRELWEETGLAWAEPAAFDSPSPDWKGFAAAGLYPSARGLAYVFRALTPPGRPRRFDARFFVGDAAGISGDLEDFSGASGELVDLSWVPVGDLPNLDTAPVTDIVLSHVVARLPGLGPPGHVPFRKNGVVR